MPNGPNNAIIYITYKKNRQILVCGYQHMLVWKSRGNFGPKHYTRKISKSHKDVEIYQVLIYVFLIQTVPKFPLCILLIRNTYNLSNPNCIITYPTTCINLILWSNVNYKSC